MIKGSFKTHAVGKHIGLKKHVDYIQRDGTDEHGGRAELYGSEIDQVEGLDERKSLANDVAKTWKDDRHHFRFIVAPEDAAQLADLRAYTTDLVTEMENELGTKLEWLAADHHNTANPHTHLIVRGVRDNGNDLVIPRRYLSYGMRRHAEQLVEAELGPMTQIEGRVRLAKTVEAERVTDLDRALSKQAEQGVIDLSGPAQRGRVWHRRLMIRRLRHLSVLGLAEPQGGGHWRIEPDSIDRLRQMGERGDIVKALHSAMKGQAPSIVTEDNIFDPNRLGSRSVTGRVTRFGKIDDTHSDGYVVIEALDGRLVHAAVADDETFETLQAGQVVTFEPHHKGPRSIDRSISEFADQNGGIYSEARHATEGDRVSADYARAHVRRLEALRRQKYVVRRPDGSWRIPSEYLDRAADYETERAKRLPTSVRRDSRLTLREMETARGVTWIDRKLTGSGNPVLRSKEIQAAMAKRVTVLKGMGFEKDEAGRLPSAALEKLEAIDLGDAASGISVETGKSYTPLGDFRHVDGIYSKAIERPSGKFAVIERSKDFTLVPWRPVMENRLSRSIRGRVSLSGISWDVIGRQGQAR
ncbi:conjugal transfer protein TraI [Algimonas ampicilliniresistens]|uniref:Conjugal transfer protein TraI n=1 Tax=Algimonas ampicilliniresistens TaxID=1298735 RepID=A0ABQ5V9Y5_9PROT|nr:conjugal transfer protein TraI [Algimonas ampicilliniresistens]